MGKINELRGTNYDLVDYYGDPEATEVIISMGLASPTIQQTVAHLNSQGRKVGHINIHLYRPFPTEKHLGKTAENRGVPGRSGPHQRTRLRRRTAAAGRAVHLVPS